MIMIILYFLLLFLGLVIIIKSADLLIDGSVSIARKFKIPEIVIGLTIISIGTSAPELIVNIFASIKGSGGLAWGNVIGSNICNLFLILGFSSIIYPITVKKNTVYKEIPFLIISVIIIFLFANFSLFNFNRKDLMLDRIESGILLFLFLLFLFYVYRLNKKSDELSKNLENIKILKLSISILFTISGFIGLFLGGKITVDNAVNIAKSLGVSEKLIALTIISIGTSLPELVTSTVAAFKKKSDIAIGNIIGSNIFNTLFILSISGLIKPIPFQLIMNIDLTMLFLGSLLLFITMFILVKHTITRLEGIIFLVGYISYIIYLIIRK